VPEHARAPPGACHYAAVVGLLPFPSHLSTGEGSGGQCCHDKNNSSLIFFFLFFLQLKYEIELEEELEQKLKLKSDAMQNASNVDEVDQPKKVLQERNYQCANNRFFGIE